MDKFRKNFILFIILLFPVMALSQDIKFYFEGIPKELVLGEKYELDLFIYNLNPKINLEKTPLENALKLKKIGDVIFIQSIESLNQSKYNADLWIAKINAIWLKKDNEVSSFTFMGLQGVFQILPPNISSLVIKTKHIKESIQYLEEDKTLTLSIRIIVFIFFSVTLFLILIFFNLKKFYRKKALKSKRFELIKMFKKIESKKDLDFFYKSRFEFKNLFKEENIKEKIIKCTHLLVPYIYKKTMSPSEINECRYLILNLLIEIEKSKE